MGNLPNPGIEPTSSSSHALADRFFSTVPPGGPIHSVETIIHEKAVVRPDQALSVVQSESSINMRSMSLLSQPGDRGCSLTWEEPRNAYCGLIMPRRLLGHPPVPSHQGPDLAQGSISPKGLWGPFLEPSGGCGIRPSWCII